MEEENKQQEVAVVEEPQEEAKPVEEKNNSEDPNMYSLATFIIATVGLMLCHGWFIGDIRGCGYGTCVWWVIAGIACAVLGLVALPRVKKLNANKQPFKVFDKFSKIIAIVDVPLGFLVAAIFVARIIYLIIINLPE